MSATDHTFDGAIIGSGAAVLDEGDSIESHIHYTLDHPEPKR